MTTEDWGYCIVIGMGLGGWFGAIGFWGLRGGGVALALVGLLALLGRCYAAWYRRPVQGDLTSVVGFTEKGEQR